MASTMYSIWRISPDGKAFQLTTTGTTSVKERAMEKARLYNERLLQSDPETEDLFVVRDGDGREFKPAELKKPA